jgi:peptidylprolyl isomerase
MKTFLTTAGIALVMTLPIEVPAQQTATAKPPARRATTAGSKPTASTKTDPTARPSAIKLPASIPPAKGVVKTEYALRYIDVKIGTGATAEPSMIYSVHYTGWLYDGTKFDSSVDRGTPIEFMQGQHRVIIGWDSGFEGMRVGGKRRLFIPYQLAYGETAKGPIPAKSNLIFDVELVDVKDPNAPQPASAPPQ